MASDWASGVTSSSRPQTISVGMPMDGNAAQVSVRSASADKPRMIALSELANTTRRIPSTRSFLVSSVSLWKTLVMKASLNAAAPFASMSLMVA